MNPNAAKFEKEIRNLKKSKVIIFNFYFTKSEKKFDIEVLRGQVVSGPV